ncbi:probable protein phosphatase 2C 67 [Salvia hispanica]|uniref:probable protein phosphatase 2C 67 n=1 Tax=Salvia hispanica TaxID=49212 RepID=UPI0020090003|nr:probable protein phosphatase 2C 67 [Salvia hispanica]
MGQVRVVTAGSSKAVLWGLIKPKTNIVTTSVNHCASEQHAREEVWKQIDSRDVGFEKTDGKYRVNDLTMATRSIADAYLRTLEFNRLVSDEKYKTTHERFPVLSSEPSIFNYKLGPKDKFVIFASRGLSPTLRSRSG